MKKIPLLAAAAAGYVLGTRAGRERYDQIAAGAKKVARDPRVKDATAKAQATVTSQATAAAEVAKEKVSDVASTAAGKIHDSGSATDSSEVGDAGVAGESTAPPTPLS